MSLSSRFIEMNELRKLRWKEHAARMEHYYIAYRIRKPNFE